MKIPPCQSHCVVQVLFSDFKTYLVLMLTLMGSCVPPIEGCPSSWVPLSTGWYTFSAFRGTFEMAQRFCSIMGGYTANITSDLEYHTLIAEMHIREKDSVWVDGSTRPEHFTLDWQSHYAPGEPNHSGDCLYLSASNDFKWRDTSCRRLKGALCERHDCFLWQDLDAFTPRSITTPKTPENDVPTRDGDVEDQFAVEMFDPVVVRDRPAIKEQSSSGCQTIDGVPCVLPFIYEGTSYSSCTAIGDFDGRPWCSTNVDESGQHKGDENWGHCQTKDDQCGLK
ncbi:uncharacterized protein LOC131882241 [Tigriopus californicus]|uniref:uncharacterized protein LOC131882241 n=1 Tax=Tigriopus californicus TaxID=6832 RepID=UPI0027DA7AF2|nr:uncharacterized protein LOC131882241 [Tigriopus californicus]|eukprot:TCALIF_12709-PA protein Name:"Similar to Sel1l Protein sel-1 homolog 1 (Mus musculus)" AED:0.00 eAED:0.00 QI:92/1/1/1/0.5/0.6/5/77/280